MDETVAGSGHSRSEAWTAAPRLAAAIVDVLAANERHIAAMQAEQVRLLAELTRTLPKKETEAYSEFLADEVSLGLTWSRSTATRRLHHAIELTTRLPQLLTALEAGTLDLWRTEIVVDTVRKLPDEVAQQVCDQAIAEGTDRTPGSLKRLLHKAVLAADPDGADRRHRAARDERRVTFQPVDDGMAELAAYLPAHEATLIHHRLDAFARERTPDDRRTNDQRRADAFRDLMLDPAMGPVVTNIHLTVPATTIGGAGTHAGDLTGYGSISATQSRELAIGCTGQDGEQVPYARKLNADPKWRRLITEPASGVLLDYGKRTYKPPAALAAYVRARDSHCVFPGCLHPSRACDLDHRVPYPEGPTSADNLAPLCRHHHRLKHEGGWTLRKQGQHNIWTTPAGVSYANHPHRPVTTLHPSSEARGPVRGRGAGSGEALLPGVPFGWEGDGADLIGLGAVAGAGGQEVGDRNGVVGAAEDLDGVAGFDLALLDDPQVRAGAARGREALDEVTDLPEAREGPARDPRSGDLEGGAADAPAFAGQGPGHREARHGQVLAELARAQVMAELALPELGVLPAVRVHRLVLPAVAPDQAVHVFPQPVDVHLDRARHRSLVDRRQPLVLRPIDLLQLAHVHRQHRSAHALTITAPCTGFPRRTM
jgi:hypothetical protein